MHTCEKSLGRESVGGLPEGCNLREFLLCHSKGDLLKALQTYDSELFLEDKASSLLGIQ